jgi:hypothetical protein
MFGFGGKNFKIETKRWSCSIKQLLKQRNVLLWKKNYLNQIESQ